MHLASLSCSADSVAQRQVSFEELSAVEQQSKCPLVHINNKTSPSESRDDVIKQIAPILNAIAAAVVK